MHVTVMEWERVLLFRDGRLQRVLEAGRHRLARRSTTVAVDMRPRLLNVPGQEVLTADGLALRLSAAVTWHVTDPVAYTTGARQPDLVLYGAAQDAVRSVVSAGTLEELTTERTRLTDGLTDLLVGPLEPVGVQITAAAARDVMLPGELRKAALETVLARERGRADLERARAEAASLRSLANTARLLEDHPSLLHLRTLQSSPQIKLVLDRPASPEQS